MNVFKFGGASIENVERAKSTAAIIQENGTQPLLVVISAKGKTTNALEEIAKAYFAKQTEKALELSFVLPMNFTGKPMKGYIYVSEEGIETQKDLTYWIQLCVDFNPIAKKSKK